MGLERTDNWDGRRIYHIDQELDFGRFKGCTPREIIDDDEGHTLEWYIENLDWFFLSEEAFDYLNKRKSYY